MSESVDIGLLRTISATGQIYAAFNYVIAVDCGVLALMPWTKVSGDMSHLIYTCPVPYPEVLLSIETSALKAVDFRAPYYKELVYRLPQLLAGQWYRTYLSCLQATLFEHESGLKMVLANELVYRKCQQ